MTRVLVAGMYYEANTFASGLGSLEAFYRRFFGEGPEIFEAGLGRDELAGAYASAEAQGVTLIPGFVAYGGSGPTLDDAAYVAIRDRILSSLVRHRGAFDGIYLRLHGAMVTDGREDAEGDLLREVRDLVGVDVPIAVSYDLHCHFTSRMAQHADIVAGYQTFPHTDQVATGRRAMDMLARTLKGEMRPELSYRKLGLISATEGHYTERGPVGEVMDQLRTKVDSGAVVDATIFATQPWLDVTELGWSVVVMTDADTQAGQEHADELSGELWARRHRYGVKKVGIAEAVAAIEATPQSHRPVVVSDGSDSPAAGSTGDGTEVLSYLLSHGFEDLSFVTVTDAPAAEACVDAGIGSDVTVDLGGTHAPQFFTPVTVSGRVITLCDGKYDSAYPPAPANAGRTAVLAVGSIRIVITEHPVSLLDQELYRRVGLDLQRAKVVLVKSAGSFRAYYEPIAAEIMELDTRGPADSDLTRLPFTKPIRPLWPFDRDVTEPLLREGQTYARPISSHRDHDASDVT